ncbi:hypothetical protein [Leeia sp.]|uniref:hypothetical protein n=1 Tax=Leeia sp. TaxID=2884678 RepID=UPI0035B39FCD
MNLADDPSLSKPATVNLLACYDMLSRARRQPVAAEPKQEALQLVEPQRRYMSPAQLEALADLRGMLVDMDSTLADCEQAFSGWPVPIASIRHAITTVVGVHISSLLMTGSGR